jgi:hypothetical protein
MTTFQIASALSFTLGLGIGTLAGAGVMCLNFIAKSNAAETKEEA